MPKKQPKNAFCLFMFDFKEEQKKKGINYANMVEVQQAADPIWRNAATSLRAKYEERAKKEKQKSDVPQKKYTSNGISFAEIEQQKKLLQEAEETELQDIKDMVKLKSFNQRILEEDIYLMDINFYCKIGTQYLVGESTVLRFNLRDGIKDHYHENINPGQIPLGYTSDVKFGSQDLGLDMPDNTIKRSDYMQILANIIDYLKQKDEQAKSLPPIFTMPDKVEPVSDFILQMCSIAAEDDTLFRVYKLDTLFYILINEIKSRHDEGMPKQSLALTQLKKDLFKYTPGLGCEHHEAGEKSVECSFSRVKRWAYTVLDMCCPVAGIDVVPGKHVPSDIDIDGILTYKEQKRERLGPSVASLKMGSSCNSSVVNEFETSTCSTMDQSKSEKRTHAPLRMPKIDYSQRIRPAPELTDANFPKLSAGHGRGRGLASSFNKLKVDK